MEWYKWWLFGSIASILTLVALFSLGVWRMKKDAAPFAVDRAKKKSRIKTLLTGMVGCISIWCLAEFIIGYSVLPQPSTISSMSVLAGGMLFMMGCIAFDAIWQKKSLFEIAGIAILLSISIFLEFQKAGRWGWGIVIALTTLFVGWKTAKNISESAQRKEAHNG